MDQVNFRFPSESAHPAELQRRGYILVVTLGLLVLASTLLVAVGRMAVQHSLAAKVAAEDSQRRWGAASCRTAVLPFEEQILTEIEARQKVPQAVYRATVPLGGQSFQLIISDEQAKANVNALLDASDQSSVEERIRESMSGTGLGNTVRLHPALSPQTPILTTQPSVYGPTVTQWVTGFGQIFDNVAPGRLVEGKLPAIDRVTCWGSGGINIMRASQASLQIAEGAQLTQSQVDRLIDARNQIFNPVATLNAPAPATSNDPVAKLMASAEIKLKSPTTIGMTAVSLCHSLWIITNDSRRQWHELYVLDETNKDHPRTDSYQW